MVTFDKLWLVRGGGLLFFGVASVLLTQHALCVSRWRQPVYIVGSMQRAYSTLAG